MLDALEATRADLETLIESVNNQLKSHFIQGSEKKQLQSFKSSLEHQLHDLIRKANG